MTCGACQGSGIGTSQREGGASQNNACDRHGRQLQRVPLLQQDDPAQRPPPDRAGVAGDAHAGETVKHRSRVAKGPTQPNLRQVHDPFELHDELNAAGFDVAAGEMGENITTRGVDLLSLPQGAHACTLATRRSSR